MAKFNRFASTQTKAPVVEDDDEAELKAIARKQIELQQPTAKPAAPLKATTAPAPQPAPLPPPRTLAQPAKPPPAPTPTTVTRKPDPAPTTRAINPAPNVNDDALRKAALDRLEREDDGMRSGFGAGAGPVGQPITGDDDGGIVVTGRHYDEPNTTQNGGGRNSNRGATQAAEEARRRAIEEAARRADEDRADGGGPLASNDPHPIDGRAQGSENNVVDDARDEVALERDDESMTDIASAELAARREDLAANRARDLMETRARYDLMGGGLMGATSTALGDKNRQYDRSDTLTLSELGRRQRDEGRADRRLTAEEKDAEANRKRADANDSWLALQRKLALDELERSEGKDLDGDGDIGGTSVDLPDAGDALIDFNEQTEAPVGRRGHKPEVHGELALPAGFDKSGAHDMGIWVNPFTDSYIGSDARYHYYSTPTGVGRMRK